MEPIVQLICNKCGNVFPYGQSNNGGANIIGPMRITLQTLKAPCPVCHNLVVDKGGVFDVLPNGAFVRAKA